MTIDDMYISNSLCTNTTTTTATATATATSTATATATTTTTTGGGGYHRIFGEEGSDAVSCIFIMYTVLTFA